MMLRSYSPGSWWRKAERIAHPAAIAATPPASSRRSGSTFLILAFLSAQRSRVQGRRASAARCKPRLGSDLTSHWCPEGVFARKAATRPASRDLRYFLVRPTSRGLARIREHRPHLLPVGIEKRRGVQLTPSD